MSRWLYSLIWCTSQNEGLIMTFQCVFRGMANRHLLGGGFRGDNSMAAVQQEGQIVEIMRAGPVQNNCITTFLITTSISNMFE